MRQAYVRLPLSRQPDNTMASTKALPEKRGSGKTQTGSAASELSSA